MIFIITYDLRTPKDYHDFYEAIKAQGEQGKWWHYMASTWLISTTKTPQTVVDALRPHLDNLDFLFVCELKSNYQGWLPKPAWDWINLELPLVNPFAAFLTGAAGIPGLAPTPPATSIPGLTTLADLLNPKKVDKP
jgi:hypothetical protein